MAKVTIDGKAYELPAGRNLLHAVLSQHLELPYFCWHPALGSVGSCRLCALIQYADADDDRGRLQMACMVPVQDGMRVSINAPFAADFRKQVIEWLMENHPHDCPVCEEGGECHLQDMTVMTGHTSRRYRGRKRTWRNQHLGPFIGHEMNRCITCYRCVRYYRDYAGGKDLEAFGSRGRMFFGREADGALESEFAGNLVEVCPTGVFTDKPFAQSYTRKWDLQSAPSLCPNCSIGCNTFPAERYGLLKRITNRYHGQVNGYFLCDRGRFGSHFVNHERRIRHAGVRAQDGVFDACGREAAVQAAARRLQDDGRSGRAMIGIGSPRASLEANFALKQLVGAENFCAGLQGAEQRALDAALAAYRRGGFRIPSLTEVESADAVLILGEDISNTAPRMALAVRQALRGATLEMARKAGIPAWQDSGVRGHGQGALSPLFISTAAPTRLDELATAVKYGAAPELSGFAIAHALDARFADSGRDAFTVAAAAALQAAQRPLIIAGCGLGQAAAVQGAANVAWALNGRGKEVMLALTGLEANSFGVALLGGAVPLSEALRRMAAGAPALVLENDLLRRTHDDHINLDNAVVLDALETPTAEAAAVVLPAATYAEQTGTFVNYETRAQRFYQVFEPTGEIQPAWRWITAIARALGRNDFNWADIDGLAAACAQGELEALAQAAPSAGFRGPAHAKVARAPHRYSGRTAMRADVSVHEPKTSVDPETPFSYSMEGQNPAHLPGALVPYVWSPGWNSNQSVIKFQQEVGGPLLGGDPGPRLLGGGDAGDGAALFRSFAAHGREAPGQDPADGFAWLPVHEVFGSEELSGACAAIAQRTPAPYVLLHPEDAKALGVSAGDGVRIVQAGASYEVRTDANVAMRTACVAQGLPGGRPLPAERLDLRADPDYRRPAAADSQLIARG